MSDPTRPPAGGVDPETHVVTPPAPGPQAPHEPILSTASIVTVVTTILALLAAFGLPLTGPQEAAVLGALAVIAPIVLGIIARNQAWSPFTAGATVRAEVAKAVRTVQGQPPIRGDW